jgi:hypothetical protein
MHTVLSTLDLATLMFSYLSRRHILGIPRDSEDDVIPLTIPTINIHTS